MVLLISIFIAVALDPAVRWFERRHVPRWVAAAGSILLLAGAVIALTLAGWSSLSQQGRIINENLVNAYNRFRQTFPIVASTLPAKDRIGADSLRDYGASFLASLLNALMLVVVGMVLTVYLLIEWRRTLEWVMAFVPAASRMKVRKTLAEARAIVFGYVTGNMVTASFATSFVFVALTLLRVPAAPLLALLAGVFDFLPVLGFLISGVPAVTLASTVSGATALAVIGLYICYHLIENYYIVPRVYGKQLKLSNLAVLIAFAIGAELGGVIGAVLALPVAATYPAIEKLWLAEKLSEDTVEKHKALEERSRSVPA
jgi:predicted PurR-regulated permease PerM